MSRVGKKPIQIPAGTEVKLDGDKIIVKGPKGTLEQKIHPLVSVGIKDNEIQIGIGDETDVTQRSLWGLFARLISNMLTGITQGFEKKLEVNGIGYKVSVQGKVLKLDVGFSHEVDFVIPEEVNVSVEKNIITVSGNDKQVVGEVAARIRRIRKPEPYKGKGIKYQEEIIARKAGKAGKAGA
ncbi:50S ribosomal protein L6 [Patescibacteria group bacterium]|nr:50S ribosomal protein L6 [Patescibacteria group bacterium]MBU1915818.1 50S ribosomal protein L6 [Patescibacteria group bacterium]